MSFRLLLWRMALLFWLHEFVIFIKFVGAHFHERKKIKHFLAIFSFLEIFCFPFVCSLRYGWINHATSRYCNSHSYYLKCKRIAHMFIVNFHKTYENAQFDDVWLGWLRHWWENYDVCLCEYVIVWVRQCSFPFFATADRRHGEHRPLMFTSVSSLACN